MTEMTRKTSATGNDSMKITVSKNGPYIVTGGVPLTTEEICNDNEGYCHTWRQVKKYPLQDKYALSGAATRRTSLSATGPTQKFTLTGPNRETGYLREGTDVIRGPALTLTDNGHLCVHARFCMRAGGIWNLVSSPEIRQRGILPSGRLAPALRPARSPRQREPGSRSNRNLRSPLSLSSTPQGRAWASLDSRRHPGHICRWRAVRDPEQGHPLPVREIKKQAIL